MKKNVYAGKHFGMALARMNVPLLNVRDFIDIPQFNAIEVPAEVFDTFTAPFSGKLNNAKFADIHCGGILEYQLSRNIAFCDRHIQDEFIKQAENVLDRLKRHSIKYATLECGMNSVLGDEKASGNIMHILQKLSPTLLKSGIVLLLPFRIPSQTDVGAENMMKFLRDCLTPNVKVRLDIHPHELSRDFSPSEYAGLLRFETRSVLFIYDADSGNRLISAHMEPWLDYFEPLGMAGPFLVCPNSFEQRMSIPETDSFAKFINDLRNR